jgi:hypothetical protein
MKGTICWMSKFFSIGIFFLIFFVSACTVLPNIELIKINSPADLRGDEVDTFALQQSHIKIAQNGTKKIAEKDVPTINISSIPEEFTDFKLGIRRADSFGVKTNINLTKFPNTELIKEAGVEVIDTRVQLIGEIGSIVTKILPIFFFAPGELNINTLPMNINTLVLLKTGNVERVASTEIDAGNGVKVKFGPLPVDAVETSSLPKSQIGASIIYSACRAATVSFDFSGERYSQTVKISDPRYLQRVSLPIKGKVSFHTECGVSVEANKDTGVSSNMAVADALVTQAKAIKDAIDAAKK